jgi:hypothetical protein
LKRQAHWATEFERLNQSGDPQNFFAIPQSLIATADELIEYQRLFRSAECLLSAQSGHLVAEFQCPLLGVKRT